MPSSFVRDRSVGPFHAEFGGTMRAAPSRSEYSVCVWRWTKPLPNEPSMPLRGEGLPRVAPAEDASPREESQTCDSQGYPHRPFRASRDSIRAGSPQRRPEIGRERVIDLDAPAGERVDERQPRGMKERAVEAQALRVVPS